MTEKTPQQKKTQTKKEAVHQCHVHNEASPFRDEVRKKVCVPASEYNLEEFESKYYCLFHFPTKDKNIGRFYEFFDKKIEQVQKKREEISGSENNSVETKIHDFRFVWFPRMVSFYEDKILAPVDFSYATFSGWANFRRAIFSDYAIFSNATFLDRASFTQATFSSSAVFTETTFWDAAVFTQATFSASADFKFSEFLENSNVFFIQTKFEGSIDLSDSTISSYLTFHGNSVNRLFINKNSSLNLENTRVTDSKKILFHTARLEPNWFINIDSSGFVFTDCDWRYAKSKKLNSKTELEKSDFRNILLTQTCRQLATNYENTKGFEEASIFRLIAHESKRFTEFEKFRWLNFLKGYKFWTLHWWYWLSSQYGESWRRAILILILILGGFAWIYTQIPFQNCPNNQPLAMMIAECKNQPENCQCRNGGLELKDAIAHSLITALFQNNEYRKPITVQGEILVILEKILAPLQAALLAFAVRRKFMQ